MISTVLHVCLTLILAVLTLHFRKCRKQAEPGPVQRHYELLENIYWLGMVLATLILGGYL